MSLYTPEQFAERVVDWYHLHGRKSLPWQQNKSLYKTWLSEIMLQQTQVKTVIPYFECFIQNFPDIHQLAAAEQDKVLNLWSGLGYYARARNLHKAAQIAVSEYGEFPNTFEQVLALPGIGRSTAGAILSLTENQPYPILDGNVKRVLCRHFAIQEWSGHNHIQKQLWAITEQLTPKKDVAYFNQAMMDIGASICTRSKPACDQCPLREDCQAVAQGLTDKLPVARPKKAKPSKQTLMYLLKNQQQEVFLYKRPQSGIWGGLYSFPESERRLKLAEIDQLFNVKASKQSDFANFRHTFTHFHLDIQAILVETDTQIAQINNKDDMWYSLQSRFEHGISAPTQKLLKQLLDEQST